MPSEQLQTLVTVERIYDPIEAHIVGGRLQSEGIQVHLSGIQHISANWMLAFALGGVQIQVPAPQADQARGILAEQVALKSEDERCPRCASTETVRENGRWRLSMLVLHAFAIPLPWGKERFRCAECSYCWVQNDDT